MPVRKIKKYLNNFYKKRPVNLLDFDKAISKLDLKHRYNFAKDVRYHKQGTKGDYIILSIDKDLLAELEEHVSRIGVDRETASLHGNSHSFKVDGSILVCRSEYEHPFVVTFDTEMGFVTLRPLKKHLLIVENLQLFLKVSQTLGFLIKYCDFNKAYRDNLDVVWGDGRNITNQYHTNFFNHYSKIFCLFDIDVGGLSIANSLMSMNPNSEFEFLYPTNLTERLSLVPTKQSVLDINKAIKVCRKQPKLKPICEIIRRTGKFIEQEDYLQWKI